MNIDCLVGPLSFERRNEAHRLSHPRNLGPECALVQRATSQGIRIVYLTGRPHQPPGAWTHAALRLAPEDR